MAGENEEVQLTAFGKDYKSWLAENSLSATPKNHSIYMTAASMEYDAVLTQINAKTTEIRSASERLALEKANVELLRRGQAELTVTINKDYETRKAEQDKREDEIRAREMKFRLAEWSHKRDLEEINRRKAELEGAEKGVKAAEEALKKRQKEFEGFQAGLGKEYEKQLAELKSMRDRNESFKKEYIDNQFSEIELDYQKKIAKIAEEKAMLRQEKEEFEQGKIAVEGEQEELEQLRKRCEELGRRQRTVVETTISGTYDIDVLAKFFSNYLTYDSKMGASDPKKAVIALIEKKGVKYSLPLLGGITLEEPLRLSYIRKEPKGNVQPVKSGKKTEQKSKPHSQ